jgi:hypothetical protein
MKLQVKLHTIYLLRTFFKITSDILLNEGKAIQDTLDQRKEANHPAELRAFSRLMLQGQPKERLLSL